MIINPKRKIEDELDFDFRADMQRIDTLDDFDKLIMQPYQQGKQRYYRGERKNSITRPLIPTLYRDKNLMLGNAHNIRLIDSGELYNIYNQSTEYFALFEKIVGKVKRDEMFSFLAFSQHYFGQSPLIDFTKSIYVALSFALKDRTKYDENILIYTLELKDDDDYTNNIDVANEWINDYSVMLLRDIDRSMLNNHLENPLEIIGEYKKISSKIKGHNLLELNSPTAKLIDVPTNDLIKFQQGVFLMLDDFSLVGKAYLTKKIRDEFCIKKWIINRSICPDLLNMIISNEPYYQYKYITNLSSVADVIKNNKPL